MIRSSLMSSGRVSGGWTSITRWELPGSPAVSSMTAGSSEPSAGAGGPVNAPDGLFTT
ncbi:hypothetical protein [Streptomyces sp. NPDC055692]|uniref:hypothetical protein n=1 Tax=Streptomyces sp. NPDC055692 TaxID=3155683 RepID=UPI00341E7D3B